MHTPLIERIRLYAGRAVATAVAAATYVRTNFRRIVWLAALALLTFTVWSVHYGLHATAWAAFIAAAAFGWLAHAAGPPYLRKGPERAVWRIRRVPPEEVRHMRRFWNLYRKIVLVQFGKFLEPPKRAVAFRIATLFGATVILLGTAAIPILKAWLMRDIPEDLGSVIEYDPVVSTRVYSADGEQICTFTSEDRVYVTIDHVPKTVTDAFIAAEDQRFFSHGGVDLVGIARAASANYSADSSKQGASTLTQQVVKQVILKDNSRSYSRKAKEVIIAVDLERAMAKKSGDDAAKRKILEVYLNHIFLGHGTYGVQAAARTYFGKDVSQLTLAEAAMLAGLPQAPSRDSPYLAFGRAKARQAYVLRRMADLDLITAASAAEAAEEPIAIVARADPLNRTAAPYFCEHVRKELKRLFGNETVFMGGLEVKTTLDMRMQRAAEAALRIGLVDLERRIGWTGPEGRDPRFTGKESCVTSGEWLDDNVIDIGRVAEVGGKVVLCVAGTLYPIDPSDLSRVFAWEERSGSRLAVGDMLSVRLDTKVVGGRTVRAALTAKRTDGPAHPEALQAGFIAIDQSTGHVKAMVGGYDYGVNQYNTVTQARRQTGSSIKPYVYLTALMHGADVSTVVTDAPRCYSTASGIWCPKNYGDRYLGQVDMRTALAKSLNSVSVSLLAKTGVDENIRTMRALGIRSRIDRVMPIAVGSVELTLYEHAFAYATIAAGGKRMPGHPDTDVPGVFLTEVKDERGTVLFPTRPIPETKDMPQAVPAAESYELVHLMKGVVELGTGRRVRELRRPAAGKTGTTNDFRDAWFLGFTADLVAGVWVGRMTPDPIAEEATGGSLALPIWLAFMKAAHPETQARDFPVPPDVMLAPDPNGEFVPYARGELPSRLLVTEKKNGAAATHPF